MSETAATYELEGSRRAARQAATRLPDRSRDGRCRHSILSPTRSPGTPGQVLLARESRSREAGRFPETLLHAAWQRAGAASATITGRDGHRYRVIYQGRPAAGAGPDFRDAILLRDDGVRLHGHIEIHVRSGDWHGHGHGSDSAYNGVAMHVVLEENGPPVETMSGVRVPLLVLKREHVAVGDAPSGPGEEGAATAAVIAPAPLPLLDMGPAGDEWFRNRSHGCAMEIADRGADQALWEGALECLGYPANKKGFRQLASRLDWRTVSEFLRREPERGADETALNDLFLWAGGFGPGPARAPELTGRAPDWRARHGRPANDPRLRVRAAATWARRWHRSGGPARTFVNAVGQAGLAGDLASLFIVPSGPGKPALLGNSRARDVVVNHLLPAVHALAVHAPAGHWSLPGTRGPGVASRAKHLFDTHPLLASNSITREASRLLSARGADGKPRFARHQQGLIHIYRMMTARQHPERQLPLL